MPLPPHRAIGGDLDRAADNRVGLACRADDDEHYVYAIALSHAVLRNGRRQTQVNGDAMQALVARPQLRSCRQPRGSKQVDIEVSNTAPEQRVAIDEM